MLGKRGLGDLAGNLTKLGVFVVGLIVVIGGIATAADNAQIMIDNFKSSPVPLTVTVGSTVTWLNRRAWRIPTIRQLMTVLAPPASRRRGGAQQRATRHRSLRRRQDSGDRQPSAVAGHHPP